MRVFCVSDIHADFKENREWINMLDSISYLEDIIIVAGDVSDIVDILKSCLLSFKQRFKLVFFTCGNHELWVNRKGGQAADSIEKLKCILKMCDEIDVHYTAKKVNGVWIVPLISWYHSSFDTDPDVTEFYIPDPHLQMADFYACRWPEPLSNMDESLSKHMDALNDELLSKKEGITFEAIREDGAIIISFSHFLPRLELCPEKRFLYYPKLPKAVGSNLLGERVKELKSDVHVFGHTHFGFDHSIEKTRYIQSPLAYPSEREKRMKSLRAGEKHMFESKEPLLIYSESKGFIPKLPCVWSDYYAVNKRDVTNLTLADYVISLYKDK